MIFCIKIHNRIIKMKEFSQEITRFNEKCKESFLDLKHFIEKNDIKQLNERIFEKNVIIYYCYSLKINFILFYSRMN